MLDQNRHANCVYVTNLRLESLVRIICLKRVRRVFYINRSHFIPIWTTEFLKVNLNIEFICCAFAHADERYADMSAFEWIRKRADQLTCNVSNYWERSSSESSVNFNHNVRAREYFLQKIYGVMLELAELQLLSKIRGEQGGVIFLLPRGMESSFLEVFPQLDLRFYCSFLPRLFGSSSSSTRISHAYLGIDKAYMFGESVYMLYTATLWLIASCFRKDWADENECIGVRQFQRKVKQFEINDFYWMWGAQSLPNLIHFEQYPLDPESAQTLAIHGIKRVRICRKFQDLLSVLRDRRLDVGCGDFRDSIIFLSKAGLSVLKYSLMPRRSYREMSDENFALKSFFWEAIYRNSSVKVLWTMADMQISLLPEAQALTKLGALQVGSTWSYYPFVDREIRKSLDVFFFWGVAHNQMFSNQSGVREGQFLLTGYPLDYYFPYYTSWARQTKKQFEGKFILAFIDNIYADNGNYSYNIYRNLHLMLSRIVNKYNNVIILLKPKRKQILDNFLNRHPEIMSQVQQGRICIYAGGSEVEKFPPAAVGMISDLVIGMGYSTAALECFFAGSTCVFFDQCRITSNIMFEYGKDKFVFSEIECLEEFVARAVVDTATLAFARRELEVCSKIIDQYQDGDAKERVASFLSGLFHESVAGLDMKTRASLSLSNSNGQLGPKGSINGCH